MEDVETPGSATTIEARSSTSPGARPPRRVLRDRRRRFVVAIVRGDYDVNETKLVNAIKATGGLRSAQVEEIVARGMQAGYGSPSGPAIR